MHTWNVLTVDTATATRLCVFATRASPATLVRSMILRFDTNEGTTTASAVTFGIV